MILPMRRFRVQLLVVPSGIVANSNRAWPSRIQSPCGAGALPEAAGFGVSLSAK